MSTMMTDQDEVTRYAAAVREALLDLDPVDREELLDDLEGHLREIVAEGPDGRSLEDRIGSPAEYAAELRSSAGLAPARRRRLRMTPAVERVLVHARTHRWARQLATFLPTLKPGWWVVRGYGAAMVIATLWGSGNTVDLFPIPPFTAEVPYDVVLTIGAVGLSVLVGRHRVSQAGWGRIVVIALDVVLLGAGLVAIGHERDAIPGQYAGYNFAYEAPSTTPYLTGPHGTIWNIYPYDESGHPLHNVLLFDQSGHPINAPQWAPGGASMLRTVYPRATGGQPIRNAYPAYQSSSGRYGRPRPAPIVPLPTFRPPTARVLHNTASAHRPGHVTLVIVDGGYPVIGAAVRFAGRTVTTDSAGRVIVHVPAHEAVGRHVIRYVTEGGYHGHVYFRIR